MSTSTGDSPQPPTACLVQNALGAHRAACVDINVVCSGFVYGLALAQSLVAVNPGTRALVIGADLYSRILDFDDRATAVLLGDGAGAAAVGEVLAGYVAVGQALYDEFRERLHAPPPLLHRMVDAGHLGRKTGQGFYH